MTLLTHAHLLDRYGPLLTEAQLGEVLHLAPGTLRNQRRRLGIPVIPRGCRWMISSASPTSGTH